MLSNVFVPLQYDNKDINLISIRNNSEQNAPICVIGVVKSNDIIGSSEVEFGASKILTTVTIPKTAGKSDANIDRFEECQIECNIEYIIDSFEYKTNNLTSKSSKKAHIEQSVLHTFQSVIMTERYPKSWIRIEVKILQSSEQDLAATINCCTLALASASIEMKDLPIASNISISRKPDQNAPLYDTINATVTFLLSLNRVAHFSCEGRLPSSYIPQLLHNAKELCIDTKKIMISSMQTLN